MIKAFRDKEAEQLFNRKTSRKLQTNIQRAAFRKLWMLDAAIELKDLRVPSSNHLEKLKGNRAGQYSIRINQQWRVCFRWYQGNVHDVEITDYH